MRACVFTRRSFSVSVSLCLSQSNIHIIGLLFLLLLHLLLLFLLLLFIWSK